jgi:hypothetical protein
MDKIKDYWPMIAFVLVFIFSLGMVYQSQGTQDTRLSTVEIVAKDNTAAIYETKLMYSEVNGKLSAVPRIEKRMDELYEYLMTYDFKPKEK